MKMAMVLFQQTHWWTKEGECLALEDMSCKYKTNVVNFLERNAAQLLRVHELILLGADDEGAYRQHEAEVERLGGPVPWLWTTPLMGELYAQSQNTLFDGPID